MQHFFWQSIWLFSGIPSEMYSILAFSLKYILALYLHSDMHSGSLFDIHSGILSLIYSGSLSDVDSGTHYDILSGILSCL